MPTGENGISNDAIDTETSLVSQDKLLMNRVKRFFIVLKIRVNVDISSKRTPCSFQVPPQLGQGSRVLETRAQAALQWCCCFYSVENIQFQKLLSIE